MRFIDLETQQAKIRADVEARILRVLDHGQYILGPEVDELEQRLADYTGARHAISVASGTDALVMALMALEIGPGDEVITTSFTFAATAEAVCLAGARPVFCDIEPDTFNLDPRTVAACITPRTRAIIAVDIFGQCADYNAINAIARQHGLAVIADAAQSFGASSGGVRMGTLGHITTTSFFPAKPLGGYGDGGAVFTNDDKLADALREIRVHGQNAEYRYARVGINGRLDTLQAAVLLAKLDIFDEELARRDAAAKNYDLLLGDKVRTPILRPGNTSAWAQYTIRVSNRERIQQALQAAGIPARIYYPEPLHRQPAYAQDISLPVTEQAAKEVLSLPMHPYLEAQDQERVAGALLEVI
jgi:UDP-2-acetamido-2-deoxy-ribo-hexuluronate aminotransferase